MAENEDQGKRMARETPWPGGRRPIEEPSPLSEDKDPFGYFADSAADENDPNRTGNWPVQPVSPMLDLGIDVVSGVEPAPAPLPRVNGDPQLPPRAWQPDEQGEPSVLFAPERFEPESTEENIRRSGLAWSAGIVFFCAVAFMLLLGWGFDLIFGSSPFGIVAGVVIGSAIGFVQFFRISSQIFQPSRRESQIKPFLSRDDDD